MRLMLKSADHLLIGGHRGCACDAPENSIAAMEEGIRRGADYLEIDLQLTKDGIPVVFHDVQLDKKTKLSGYVHEYSFAQLKEAAAGLCTMEEAMEWGYKNSVYFGLELKTVPLKMQEQNRKLVEKIPLILRNTGMLSNVFVFGQDYQVLKYLKKLDPEVTTGLIVPFVPADPAELMREMDATVYLSYIYNMTPEIIKQLHEAGFFISGAILRDDYWVQQAVELGVDMFETDNPEKYTGVR